MCVQTNPEDCGSPACRLDDGQSGRFPLRVVLVKPEERLLVKAADIQLSFLQRLRPHPGSEVALPSRSGGGLLVVSCSERRHPSLDVKKHQEHLNVKSTALYLF